MRNLLEYSGSLISNDSLIVAPYDCQKLSYENILPLNNGLIKTGIYKNSQVITLK